MRSWARLAGLMALTGLVGAVGLAGRVTPASAASPSITVPSSSAMASIPGSPMPMSVVYLTIHNGGTQSDRLLGASTSAAQKVELHGGATRNGVASMRDVASFELPAGGDLVLASGGDHLMLMGLAQPLRAGASLPLVLRFEKAGEVKVVVPVVAASGK